MTDAAVTAALEAHDALVTACIQGTIGFDEFVMAYGAFPETIRKEVGGLEGFRQRMAFHAEVARILSGLAASHQDAGLQGGAEGFIEKAVLLRLRQLLERHPELKIY